MEQRTPKQQKELEEFLERKGSGNLIVGYNLNGSDKHPELFFLHPAGSQNPAGEYDMIVKEQVKKSEVYAFVPNCMIELYSHPTLAEITLPKPEVMSLKEYIEIELLPYIHEIELMPVASTNLRNAVFAQEHDITLDQINQLVHYHIQQEELANKYGNNPIYNLPIHAIETSKGMLFFSNSKLGKAGLKNYYHQLVGNYFSVHSEIGPVRQYSIERIPPNMQRYLDAAYQKDADTGKYGFIFDDTAYQKKDFDKQGWALEFETSMEPNSTEFLHVYEHSGSRTSKHNENAWRLLYLQEHGYNREIIQSPSFEYSHLFQKLGEQINACINFSDKQNVSGEPSKSLFDLIEEVQQKAAGIIKNEYDIRGHRSFERTMKDMAYDPRVEDIRLSYPVRKAAWEGKCIYLPKISASNPDLHYICADKVHGKLRISATPLSKQVYREENGKVVSFKPENEIPQQKAKVPRRIKKNSNHPKL